MKFHSTLLAGVFAFDWMHYSIAENPSNDGGASASSLSSSSVLDKADSESRELSYDWIAGYVPRTLVVDQASIDLDQAELERLMSYAKEFDSGRAVYEQGGHSQSIARLKLKNAGSPASPIEAGTIVVGKNLRGETIRGKLVEEIKPWDNDSNELIVILVQYESNEDTAIPLDCHIGGLVVQASGNHEGCFEGKGAISIISSVTDRYIPTYHYEYEYDVFFDNINGMTLQKLSDNAEDEMFFCDEGCPYPDYQKFHDYYKRYDYADAWIQAAFFGIETNFKNGNADFSKFDRIARAEAAKTGSKTMNIWMYVIATMEKALYQCKNELGCGDDRGHPCTYDSANTWDQAVAFYVGSLEGETGSGDGVLLYDLADQMCSRFRTCGADATMHTGTSYVNNEIIQEFQNGLENVWRHHNCTRAEEIKERIVTLMTIPLIQSTLMMAYQQEYYTDPTDLGYDVDEIKGATLAASVLPLVHDCSKENAEIIYKNMKIKDNGDDPVNYQDVEDAFLQTYECLGISCDMVGGYWRHGEDEYAFNAAPCGRGDETRKYKNAGRHPGSILLWVIMSVVAVVFLAAFMIMYRRIRNQRRDGHFEMAMPEGLPEFNGSFD